MSSQYHFENYCLFLFCHSYITCITKKRTNFAAGNSKQFVGIENDGSQSQYSSIIFRDQSNHTTETRAHVALFTSLGTDPTATRTPKPSINGQKFTLGPPFKRPQGYRPPLCLRHRRPLPRHPIPHRPVVPCWQVKPHPCCPSPIPMDPINPPQHSCLVLWKTPIPELPGMDPKLLPIEVPQFKHASSWLLYFHC